MSPDPRATALISSLRPTTARKVLRALIRDGEAAALMRLRGAVANPGDLTDPDWREALFDALELVVSPEPESLAS